ncbi:MAG: hypothetical protein DMF61_15080 [Blastocatellia bacterium AA13]|nr:MAG: hypothetical protein DMF61_15080 [Blastocatellia bacterium AA13]
MKSTVIIFFFLLLCATSFAQTPPVSLPNPAGSVQENSQDEERKKLTARLEKLEAVVAKAASDSSRDKLVTAIIAGSASLFAALLAGGLTLLGQRFMAKQQERQANNIAVEQAQQAEITAKRALELARYEAVFAHTEKILEYRLKQMELFYAPMFALLKQSKALYDKMNYQIAHDEPDRYRLLDEPDDQGYRMHVKADDGSWKGFRLLDQLPAIRSNLKALTLAERILQIGEQMTKIISDYAGLASADLVDLLGEYLAHYAILSTIHKSGETVPYDPGWHKMGYYPRPLNGKIEEGYREVAQFLDEYSSASRGLLESLPKNAGPPA